MIYEWPKSRKTKEHLFDLVALANVKQERFLAHLKETTVKGSFDVKNWDAYLKELASLTPYKKGCPICGGPVSFEGAGSKQNPRGMKCIVFPSHSSQFVRGEGNLIVARKDWQLKLGKKCNHDLYIAECSDCLKSEYESVSRNTIKENDKKLEVFYANHPNYDPAA